MKFRFMCFIFMLVAAMANQKLSGVLVVLLEGTIYGCHYSCFYNKFKSWTQLAFGSKKKKPKDRKNPRRGFNGIAFFIGETTNPQV